MDQLWHHIPNEGMREAVALVSIDGEITKDVLQSLNALESVQQLKILRF